MDNLEQLLELIPEEQRETAGSFILSQIEAEKLKGIEAANNKGKENATLRNRLNSLAKDLGGYDSEKESWEDFEGRLTTKLKVADESSVTLAQLNEKFEALNKQYTTEVSKRQAKEKEIGDNKIKEALTKEIGDKIWGSSAIIENTILKNDLIFNDNKIITKDGGEFGDYVSNILETYKDHLKSEQKPGVNKTIVKNESSVEEDDFVSLLKARMKNR